jgi:protein-disulfide isomerase
VHIIITMLFTGFLLLPAPYQARSDSAATSQAKSGAASAAVAAAPAPATASEPTKATNTVNKDADCGCEIKLPQDAIALVGGIKITPKEIDDLIKVQVDELQGKVVQARNRELDLQINTKLLSAEAKRRGITQSELIDREVVSKVTKPTEADALEFFDKNKNRIEGEFAQLKPDIMNYLLDKRQREQAKKFADSLRAAAELKIYVTQVTPPKTALDRTQILASINGENITSADVEDSLRALIFSIQDEVYKLRKTELDVRVNDILLEQEAQRRKITTKALLDAEVAAKLKQISVQDARVFYEKNKDRMTEDFEHMEPRIIAFLQEREEHNSETAFAFQLRKTSDVQIFLKSPESPVFSISTDDQPSRGKADAAVTIVEFTDYQCPNCATVQPVLEGLLKEYGDNVRLVVRDFPLPKHANASKAAEAAEAARAQGKYWEYIEKLFHNQSALTADKLKEYAGELGLDRAKFDAELDSGKYSSEVQRDMADGMRLAIDSTPTIFINGRKFDGDKTRDVIKAAIDEALKGPSAK